MKIFKWARQVLAIELNINLKERLKQKKQYLKMSDKGMALVVEWKQTVNYLISIFLRLI